jgi:hypothetical protein
MHIDSAGHHHPAAAIDRREAGLQSERWFGNHFRSFDPEIADFSRDSLSRIVNFATYQPPSFHQ